MSSYVEIEDLKEVARLQKLLCRRVERQAPHVQTRSIGYPSGQFKTKVHFTQLHGESTWWASLLTDNGSHWVNLIGRGNPDEDSLLMIDLQFNMAARQFNRRVGGTFVREDGSRLVFIAHRGIVTRGKSRVSWDRLTSLTTEQPMWVSSSDRSREIFLVAAMDSEDLLGDMARFAKEIREAVDRVGPTPPRGPIGAAGSKRGASDPFEIILRSFADEFSGKRKLPARKATMAVVRHGRVVRRLNEMLKSRGQVQSSRKVDLFTAGSRKEVYLFEVKTSTDTTSLYTGIGQLFMHGAALSGQFRGKTIRKVLVIPGLPSATFRDRVRVEIGIDILTYDWGARGAVDFEPLEAIGID